MLYRSVLVVGAAAIAVCAFITIRAAAIPQGAASSSNGRPVMPRYAADRALLLPSDYREWVLAGTSLGLSYTPTAQADERPMFKETLIEPTAYHHFASTGTFREGTMLALIVHGTGENTLPGRHGQFASEIYGIELAVKDSSRVPEGWAYYVFAGKSGPTQSSAKPMPKDSCYTCHAEHAQRDNVFTQFYSLLSMVAPARP